MGAYGVKRRVMQVWRIEEVRKGGTYSVALASLLGSLRIAVDLRLDHGTTVQEIYEL